MDQGSCLSEKMRHEHPGDESISGAVSAGRIQYSTEEKMLTKKQEALRASIRELEDCVDYIDWKQNFYDEVLAGKRPYISNLIRIEE